MCNRFWSCAALLLVLLATPAFAVGNQNYPARDDGLRRQLDRDEKMAATDGGALRRYVANVLVDRHAECRWLDNNNPEVDYFVPTGTPTDWDAFLDNAPTFVRADRCCPEVTVALTASDGTTTQSFTLETGRENSAGPFGHRTISHTFNMNDGSTSWDETVTEEYICTGGTWTGQGQVITGGAGTWDIGAWGACSAACDGEQTRTVVCKDSDGAVVADSVCGSGKPTTVQSCGPTCEPSAGSCKTYVKNVNSHPGCTSEIVDKRRGKACDPTAFPMTDDLALCTIEVGCACEPSIVVGCYVDTLNWDVFSDTTCSAAGDTYGDADGNRSATFSVGDTPTPGFGGRPAENYHFAEPERFTINWTGDCTGDYSMCGGVAHGAFGRRVLTTTVTVYDKYLDKTHTFPGITAEVNTKVCGYFGYAACVDGKLDE